MKKANNVEELFVHRGYEKELCYGGFKFTKKDNDISKVFHFDFIPDYKLYVEGEITPTELHMLYEMMKELKWIYEKE